MVIDLDFKQKYSWQSVLSLLVSLCGGAADMSFDIRSYCEHKLPTAEFRLDNPSEIELPTIEYIDGARIEKWSNGAVVICEESYQPNQEGDMFLLSANGAGAVCYRAFKNAVLVLKQLGLEAEFSWSSIPLAPICMDMELLNKREEACYAFGSVHTIWVKEESDEKVIDAIKAVKSCGKLQVQNMTTANTWIGGNCDYSMLVGILGKIVTVG